jgi:serine/threonine protein kinase
MTAIGLRVGPFEILGPTDVPEPGDWHLARRTGMTRRQPHEVLVRLLPSDASPDERQALHRQFEVLKALEDGRIPEAVAFYEGLGAMALASVEGITLRQLIAKRRHDKVNMSPATLLDIVLEIADTLQRVHHRNRVHGDLSPDRVLLGTDGKVWLFGFGQPPGATPDHEWLAPERRAGNEPTAQTDQWYLGAIAAGLVTGLSPYQSDEEAARGDLGKVLKEVEAQWPALGRVLRQLTEPRPDNRFPNMHPVRQQLLALSRQAGGTSERRELGARYGTSRSRAIEAANARPPEPEPEPEPERSDAFEPPEPEEEAETQIIDAANASALLAELGLLEEVSGSDEGAPPASALDGVAPSTSSLPDDVSEEEDSEEALTDPNPLAAVGLRPGIDKLPEEPFPVVRPDVSDEVPVATLGRLPTDEAQGKPLPGIDPVFVADEPAEPEPPSLPGKAPDDAIGLAPRFEPPANFGVDPDDSEESATVIFRADAIADITDEYFGGMEGGAATAVPATDSGELSGALDTDDTTDVPSDARPDAEVPEPEEAHAPASGSGGPPDLLRLAAPLLVLLFVLTLALWFLTRLL